MKLLATIIWMGCICACSSAEGAEKVISQNVQELEQTKLILSQLNATNDKIKAGINQQQNWMSAINKINEYLVQINQLLAVQSFKVLDTLKNASNMSKEQTDRVAKGLSILAQLQLSTKQQIFGLERKMEAYQKHVIRNARTIDSNIFELTKLITRAVLPQLNGLQCSYDRLETSQINVEVELKGLGRIKETTEHSRNQLSLLGNHLSSLNRTQKAGLQLLTFAVRQLKPIDSWNIENALRELIISQKRIELDLEACQKRSSSQYSHHSQSYAAPLPQSTKQQHPVQSWSMKQPNQQSISSTNPNYRYHAATPRKLNNGREVSWKVPLPWEIATDYQSAPAPQSYQPIPDRKRPTPSPTYTPQPRSGSAQSQSPSYQYYQQGAKPGQQISWYSVSSQ